MEWRRSRGGGDRGDGSFAGTAALLGRWAAAQKTPQSVALRARILRRGRGESNSQIARTLGVSRPTVILWRRRFDEGGTVALTETKPGRGRKPVISAAKMPAERTVERCYITVLPGHARRHGIGRRDSHVPQEPRELERRREEGDGTTEPSRAAINWMSICE